MARKKSAPGKTAIKVRLKRPPSKVARPPRVVRQLTRFQTRLERMAARAAVLKDRAAARENTTAVAAHDKAHSVLLDAKQRIEQIAKGVGA